MNNNRDQALNNNSGNSAPISAEQVALAQLWSAVGENAQLQAQVATATANRLLQIETAATDSAATLATAVLELQKMMQTMDARLRNIESRMEKSMNLQTGMTPVIHSLVGAPATR